MKKFLLFSFIFIYSVHLFPRIAEKYITLEHQNVRLKNFGFRLVGVTNAMSKKRLIGFVEKRSTYTRIPAFFREDIDREMSAFIKRNLMPSAPESDLIVRVNDLTVYETHMEYQEKTVANVSLTFIFKKNDRYFEKFTVIRHASKMRKNDATKWLPEVIARAIAACFDDFYEQYVNNNLDNIEITKDKLEKKPLTYKELREKYLDIDRSEKGIYHTFFDFQQGTTDLKTGFDIVYKTRSTKDNKDELRYALIKNAGTGEPINDVWGFTDGKRVFTLIGKNYHPLYRDSEGYYLRITAASKEDQNALSVLVLMNGLGAVALMATSSQYYLMRLDIVTGKVALIDESSGAGTEKEDEKVIRFFSSSYNPRDSELYLIINGEMQCILKRETWYKYMVDKPGDSLSLTLVSAYGFQMSKTIVKEAGRGDIYLLTDNKKKAPAMKKVYPQQVQGVESLMTPENRIYKKEKTDGKKE